MYATGPSFRTKTGPSAWKQMYGGKNATAMMLCRNR